MMNIKLATDNRKATALRLAKIIGGTSRYTLVPRCAYEVGPYFIEKDGTITVPEDADLQPLMALAEEGLLEPFEAPARETDTAATEPQRAADEEETGNDTEGLTISQPVDGFNPDSLDRLQKLVDSKATLIRKALGADRLTIQSSDDTVRFHWWDTLPEPEEARAATAFIAALCKMAKEAKRVTATEKEVESEKYTFRGFLLRLGFIGTDSKQVRKALLKNLSGASAFPNKAAADAFAAVQKARREAAKAASTQLAANVETNEATPATEADVEKEATA